MASCTTTMIYKETSRFNVFLSSTWKLLEKCDFEDQSYALIIQKATEATKIKDVRFSAYSYYTNIRSGKA